MFYNRFKYKGDLRSSYPSIIIVIINVVSNRMSLTVMLLLLQLAPHFWVGLDLPSGNVWCFKVVSKCSAVENRYSKGTW
jgi:hypothetical protein